MSAVAGIFSFEASDSKDKREKKVGLMAKSMTHRGSDAQFFYNDSYVSFAQNELNISNLPFNKNFITNEYESKIIVLDGEIYNCMQLIKELRDKGHIFKSNSVSEVILHGFEEWGSDVAKKLTGAFVFAIWDKIDESIYIARDMTGEKPLYYFIDDTQFIFSSELKGIVSALDNRPRISRQAMELYFAYSYITEPYTIFEDINKLEKASFMYIEKSGIKRKELYWSTIDFLKTRTLISDFNIAKKTLREAIINAVETQMPSSDVPAGTFLSGGIDSSIVTALAAKISDNPIKSFCIGFANKNYDESYKARQIADICKTQHITHYLTFKDLEHEFDKIILNYDEPFADSSCIPTYYVSKLAKDNGMKVILTGDGSDEFFAGYNRYNNDDLVNLVSKCPKLVLSLFNNIANTASISTKGKTFKRKMATLLNIVNENNVLELRKDFKNSEVKRLINHNEFVVNFDKNMIAKFSNLPISYLDGSMLIEQELGLPGDMFVKVDRAAMLNSLETRTPFVDKNVVKCALSIPSKFKKKGKIKKYILKEAFADMLPQKIINQKKQGFALPVGDWLRNELKSDLDKLTSDSFIEKQDIFNRSYVDEMKANLYSGLDIESARLWRIFAFQKWYVNFYGEKI